MAVGEPGLGTMGMSEVDGRSLEVKVVELLQQWVVWRGRGLEVVDLSAIGKKGAPRGRTQCGDCYPGRAPGADPQVVAVAEGCPAGFALKARIGAVEGRADFDAARLQVGPQGSGVRIKAAFAFCAVFQPSKPVVPSVVGACPALDECDACVIVPVELGGESDLPEVGSTDRRPSRGA